MAVLEVSTRFRRCWRTAKMDQASGLHRSCRRMPDNFRSIRERLQRRHKRIFSKKVSSKPLIKFTLQPEGWHNSSLPKFANISLQDVLASPIPFLILLYLGCSDAPPGLNSTVPILLAVIISLFTSCWKGQKSAIALKYTGGSLYQSKTYRPLRSSYELQQRHHTFESNCSLNKLLVQ